MRRAGEQHDFIDDQLADVERDDGQQRAQDAQHALAERQRGAGLPDELEKRRRLRSAPRRARSGWGGRSRNRPRPRIGFGVDMRRLWKRSLDKQKPRRSGVLSVRSLAVQAVRRRRARPKPISPMAISSTVPGSGTWVIRGRSMIRAAGGPQHSP